MPRRQPPLREDRASAREEMFPSTDERSLRRGRRVAPRTPVCRPALVWRKQTPENKIEGVMLDLNPYGMKLRMLTLVAPGTELMVQMMRDEEFRFPLSPPIRARVVRAEHSTAGFIDHGVKVLLARIRQAEEGRLTRSERTVLPPRQPARMHTMDFTVADREIRRTGRPRG